MLNDAPLIARVKAANPRTLESRDVWVRLEGDRLVVADDFSMRHNPSHAQHFQHLSLAQSFEVVHDEELLLQLLTRAGWVLNPQFGPVDTCTGQLFVWIDPVTDAPCVVFWRPIRHRLLAVSKMIAAIRKPPLSDTTSTMVDEPTAKRHKTAPLSLWQRLSSLFQPTDISSATALVPSSSPINLMSAANVLRRERNAQRELALALWQSEDTRLWFSKTEELLNVHQFTSSTPSASTVLDWTAIDCFLNHGWVGANMLQVYVQSILNLDTHDDCFYRVVHDLLALVCSGRLQDLQDHNTKPLQPCPDSKCPVYQIPLSSVVVSAQDVVLGLLTHLLLYGHALRPQAQLEQQLLFALAPHLQVHGVSCLCLDYVGSRLYCVEPPQPHLWQLANLLFLRFIPIVPLSLAAS